MDLDGRKQYHRNSHIGNLVLGGLTPVVYGSHNSLQRHASVSNVEAKDISADNLYKFNSINPRSSGYMSSKRERDERRLLREKKFSAENVYGNH